MTTLDFIGFTSVKDAGAYFGDSDNLDVAVSLTLQLSAWHFKTAAFLYMFCKGFMFFSD